MTILNITDENAIDFDNEIISEEPIDENENSDDDQDESNDDS